MNTRITLFLILNTLLMHACSKAIDPIQRVGQQIYELDENVIRSKICARYQNVQAEDIANATKLEPIVWYELMWYNAHTKEQEKDTKLLEKLHTIANNNHDIVQQAFTRYVESQKIEINILKSFINFGAQPEEKASTSAYAPLEILETRYGTPSKKTIAGIKCRECDSWGTFFRWLFGIGYDRECTTLKESLKTLKHQPKSKKLTKAN